MVDLVGGGGGVLECLGDIVEDPIYLGVDFVTVTGRLSFVS